MELSMFTVQYRYYDDSALQEYGHAGWDVDWRQFDTFNAAQQFITDAQVNPDIRDAAMYNPALKSRRH
jgi:hypothetical protein